MEATGTDRKPFVRPFLSLVSRAVGLGCGVLGLLLAVPAAAQGPATDTTPAVLTAEVLRYDYAERTVEASGDVELSQGKRVLFADRLTYDLDADRVRAEGDVALLDEGVGALFGEEMEVKDDLKDGFVRGVGALLKDGSRLAALKGTREGGVRTTLDEATYSPCPVCRASPTPLWQLKAERVVHDEASQTIVYRNATFEILGVPIAYTPYFYHPDPTVRRRTGLLTPEVGTSTELGATLKAPYYVNLAPNRDVTLTPMLTTKEGALLGVEVRDLQPFGSTRLAGSITRGEAYRRRADDDGHEVRGNIEGTGRYTVEDRRYAGFDLAYASDNTYLDRYDISNEDVLENRLYLERYAARSLLSIEGLAFQGLREDDDQGLIPIVLPLARAETTLGTDRFGGRWTSTSSLLALTRIDGPDTRRASSEIAWDRSWLGNAGDLRRLTVRLRGDAYSTNDEAARGGPADIASESRLVPSATLDWSWPLTARRAGWQYVVEPVLSATWTGDDVNREDIPNEDSLDFELDETNLFAPSRFTGIDRVESGPKLAYGLRFDAFGPGGWEVSGLFGQSVRGGSDDLFAPGSGLDGTFSDYVGRIDVRPSPFLDVGYRFRLSNDEFALRRSDLRAEAGPDWFRVNLQLLNLSENLPDRDIDERKEVTAGLQLQLLDNLAVAVQTRRDLEQFETVRNTYGLIYTHPCLVLVAGVEQSFTRQGELNDETRFGLRISFKGLGNDDATNDF